MLAALFYNYLCPFFGDHIQYSFGSDFLANSVFVFCFRLFCFEQCVGIVLCFFFFLLKGGLCYVYKLSPPLNDSMIYICHKLSEILNC